jgi:hypothetical protein
MHPFSRILFCSVYLFHACRGFTSCTTSTTSQTLNDVSRGLRRTIHFSSYNHNGENYNDDNRKGSPYRDWRDDPRINILNLLTQRAIQSFMFLCESVRDPHSGKWMQDFFETKNQLEYHGTGASYCTTQFGGTWDGPLLAMMEQPKDVVVVSAKRRGRCVQNQCKRWFFLA